MEYILINLFGGGTLDWQDVGQTEFCWEDIIEIMKNYFGKDMEDWDINDFYWGVLYFALTELENTVDSFVADNIDNEEIKKDIELLQSLDIDEDFDIFCNCLDTHCTFIGDEELGRVLVKYFKEDIDKIDDNIGFTYIEMNLD